MLGVKGTVIITHGSAKRRMIGFACEVAATTARARVPELIAAALAEDTARLGRGHPASAEQEVTTT